MSLTERLRGRKQNPEQRQALQKLEKIFDRTEMGMIRRMIEKGPKGFHHIPSAEQPPLGQVIKNPSRFKPAR